MVESHHERELKKKREKRNAGDVMVMVKERGMRKMGSLGKRLYGAEK